MLKDQKGVIETVIIGIVALLALSGGAAVVASRNAVPGDLLFPVKQQVEAWRLQVSAEGKAKAVTVLGIAKADLNELQQLQKRGASPDKIKQSLDSLVNHQRQAEDQIKKAQGQGKDVRDLENQLEVHQDQAKAVLEQLKDKLPEASREGIDRALEAIEAEKEHKEDTGKNGAEGPSSKPGAVDDKSSSGGSSSGSDRGGSKGSSQDGSGR